MTLNTLTLIPFISVILYVFILVIIITSSQTRLSKAFSNYVISMIVWSIGSFLMKLNIAPSPLFWNMFVLQIGFIMVPVFLLQFSYALINKTGKKPFLRIAYFASALLIATSVTGNVVTSAEVINGKVVYELASGAYAVAFISSLISILAFVTMAQAVRNKQVSMKKVRLVIIGISLVIIGGALNINVFLGQFAIDIILNTISAVLITYSIYRNKFLEINLVVKKGLYFSIYNISLFAMYTAIIILSYNFLHELTQNIIVVLLIMSPVFMLLEPIRRLLQRWADRIFYRANIDREVVLREFSSIVGTSFSLEKINSSLLAAIKAGMESKYVSLLLKNAVKYELHETTLNQDELEETSIYFNTPIVQWFKDGNEILLRNQIDNHIVFKKMWDSEKQTISYYQTELIVPIRYLKEIIGLVVISSRNDGLPYTEVEIQFLTTLLNNAAAIIENAKQIEQIKLQSITDELTKLYNHRYFHDTVGQWFSDNAHPQFGVAIVDIDQFKIYNDLYGHSSGDKALRRIAELIKAAAPDDSLVVRYDGEEFAIYYPNYGIKETIQAINDVRKEVERNFLLSTEIKEFLTVSVGAACYPDHGTNIPEIVSNAFSAVTLCKQSGRNKAIVYSPEDTLTDVNHDVQAKIKAAYLSSTYALAATIDAKDHYTFGHSNNVAELSVALAKSANFIGEDLETIRAAGLLHDIGKVGIPESVLLKQGYLTDQEMETMRSHVVQSINIIKHIPNLVDTIPIIISHHERYDGFGYPRGISGENIPILGRVICIADAFDAMTTDRPYRKGLSLEQALHELQKNSGTQFDPFLVEKFIGFINTGGLEALKLENRPSF